MDQIWNVLFAYYDKRLRCIIYISNYNHRLGTVDGSQGLRRVWRYQRVIRIRISKKNRQHNGQQKKYKQRSTKHTYKTKDRVTRIPLKPGDELRCSGRVGSSCSTSGIRRVNLVTNPVINRELGKDREMQLVLAILLEKQHLALNNNHSLTYSLNISKLCLLY